MKLKLAVVLLMLAATSIGFFIGRFQAGGRPEPGHAKPELSEAELSEAFALMEGREESLSGVETARDVRAIEFIESGETKRAVQLLSHPIAHHYYSYAIHASTDRGRKLRALVEQLVSTNKILADEMTNQAKYYDLSGKIQ
jgi:hypothetical protein